MNIFTDPRDGEVYKTVEINGKIWLAENLRYKGPVKRFNDWTVEEKDFYYPPDGNSRNIKKYGCLYTWNNALKAIPDGWHLPSKEEYEELLKAAGDTEEERFATLVGLRNWGGSDPTPAGHYNGGDYGFFRVYAFFWSGTKFNNTCHVYALLMGYGKIGLSISSTFETHAFSVRCIKD